MSTKKADLRDKINKKTKTKSTNKSSTNKQVKKYKKTSNKNNVKQSKTATQVQKNEIKTQKQEEIKLVQENEQLKEEVKKQKKITKIKKEKNKKPKEQSKQQKTHKLKTKFNKILQIFKRRKYYILCFIIAIIIITTLLIVLPNSDEKIFFSFKEYKLGTKVTLSDDSTWYVVEDSSSEKSKVTLLSENVLDINKDKKISDKDKLAYDKDNKCVYDTKKEKNIGYFLENDVKELLKEIDGISEIRLLTSDEYINIRKTMDFGYDWKEGNWLASESLNSWWLETSRYNKIYTVTKRGSYKLSEAKSKNYVRPVIEVDKNSVK